MLESMGSFDCFSGALTAAKYRYLFVALGEYLTIAWIMWSMGKNFAILTWM